MKAVIRLYKCHDMDLLLLKMVYHVNLAKTAKLCLKAFVDHENIVFLPCESPNPEIKYVYKKSQTKQAVRQIQFPTQSFVLRLNDDTEAPYITFWNSIIPGYRTMFLKQLLRMYLRMPVLSEYVVDRSGLQHTEYLNPPVPYEIALLQKDGMRQQESSSVWEHQKAESQFFLRSRQIPKRTNYKILCSRRKKIPLARQTSCRPLFHYPKTITWTQRMMQKN